MSIASYQHLLELTGATFSKIEHEDAMVAVVYTVRLSNGQECIVKICDRVSDYLREVHFLQHFRDVLPVPKIIRHVQTQQGGAILMEQLPGALLAVADLTEALAYEIGCCLGQIHLSRLSGYGDPISHLNADPRAYFAVKFEEGLAECQPHLPVELWKQCQQYYQENLDLLLMVDGPCVVHRDFRPGNLMVKKGKLQGIIDWAGARAGFAEEDLATLEHAEWSQTPHIQSILAGYAASRTLPDYKRLAPLLRLSKAIAMIGFMVKRQTWKNTGARVYQYNRQFLESFFKKQL